MTTQKWLNWIPDEWELETAPISNTMKGVWSIIKGRTIKSDNLGTCNYSILEWANILRTPEKEIINVFKYLDESPIEVFSEIDEAASIITIKYLPIMKKYEQQQKDKLKKDSNNNEKRREKLLEYLKSIYHPKKTSIQTIKSKRIFMQIMEEASNKAMRKMTETLSSPKPITNKKVRKQLLIAEKNEFIKIKNHIITLRQTPIWEKKNGQYLLGFGNFLDDKGWQNKPTPLIFKKKAISRKLHEDPAMQGLKELMENDPATST